MYTANYVQYNFVILLQEKKARRPQSSLTDEALVLIPLYSLILLLAVIGNVLVILTLLQNKRMRTPTNVLLLNLAVSDLLLGVVCVPFTFTGYLLQDFVFGALMCRIIPYMQGNVHYLYIYNLIISILRLSLTKSKKNT